MASGGELLAAGGQTVDTAIVVRGARVHNLQEITVEIPRDRLVVLTGVSGSGKSSLAFNTLFAEGQRRYLESLSIYARQFIDQLERPDVDEIEGLPPTVAIEQDTGAGNPRSTVSTVTEIHDYLRLLFARTGEPHCPDCGHSIRSEAPERIVANALEMPEGRKVIVLAPVVRGRKGLHLEVFESIRKAGLIRARVNGEIIEVNDVPPRLVKTKEHDIEAVVDRLVIRPGIRPRLAESVDRALELGEGRVILSTQQEDGTWKDRLISSKLACPTCGRGFEALEPRSFSFNSPHGACPACQGIGAVSGFDLELLLPPRHLAISPETLPFWSLLRPKVAAELALSLRELQKRFKISARTSRAKWTPQALEVLIQGDEAFPGLIPSLEAVRETSRNETRRDAIDIYRQELRCGSCQGARLKPEVLAVKLGGHNIADLSALAVEQLSPLLANLRFDPPLDQVGPPIVKEVVARLDYLTRVGLGYLSLDRRTDTLSGGEYQRVRLASVLGSGLVGAGFILDEPTAGLHPRDTARLLESLRDLRDAGNSLIVVEHDETMIEAADWVIDLGPGAGPDGGRVVAQGKPSDLEGAESITARYLEARRRARGLLRPTSHQINRASHAHWVEIKGAREHNLKGEPVRFPLSALTCFTGVSGSGKSTLVLDILARATHRKLHNAGPRPGTYRSIEGIDDIDKLVVVDQAPIGRTPRSTPATYTGLFDAIRQVFAQTREAKIRGFKANRYSFNVKGGRCEACLGQGQRRVAMQFLPDLFVTCEACAGKRFNRPTLEARYKGKSIGDVLEMRVDEAKHFFDAVPAVSRGLEALHEAGLGYLRLGQSSTTLSGGESQRVKLAAELGRPTSARTLFILDEPTTGLHFADVENLIRVLRGLVQQGNSVVVIEHQLDVIRAADWIVDLGPEGGEAGGQVIAQGPPSLIASTQASFTGAYLRE